jgi:hypothetical protein
MTKHITLMHRGTLNIPDFCGSGRMLWDSVQCHLIASVEGSGFLVLS